MAIDVSRVKRTRCGHEVRIYATDGGGSCPIHGAYKRDDQWLIRMWTASGRDDAGVDDTLDLIEEPRTVDLDLWIDVYKDGTTTTWHNKRDAETAALRDRIACFNIKRTVTEGEGL